MDLVFKKTQASETKRIAIKPVDLPKRHTGQLTARSLPHSPGSGPTFFA